MNRYRLMDRDRVLLTGTYEELQPQAKNNDDFIGVWLHYEEEK